MAHIQDSSARSTAKQACNQITTADASAALRKAKRRCLNGAAHIPIASVKHRVDAECNKIAAP